MFVWHFEYFRKSFCHRLFDLLRSIVMLPVDGCSSINLTIHGFMIDLQNANRMWDIAIVGARQAVKWLLYDAIYLDL